VALTARQQALLDAWLPGAEVIADHSWGLVGTFVLELCHGGERYIAKAGDAGDRHIARELAAHHDWLSPWTSRGRAPELVNGDADAKLILTGFLPGDLVQGSPGEWVPDTYRRAGELLALFHGQLAVPDPTYEEDENTRTLANLDKPHTIPPELVSRLRAEILSWDAPPSVLVPTHGDWQPRNWLIEGSTVKVIDFGRAALRPAHTDFVRMASQQFLTDPTLETAFVEGYGSDPRDPARWHYARFREAVNTTVWAHAVGDDLFEQQGRRMIDAALATL
jgi:hypothetical protein